MNILHHIYAATCKNRGFGVFYQSPELSMLGEDTLNIIKKNATYKEPYLLNSSTGIDRYPVNYEYYYVSNAGILRNVLAFSKYTGATNHTPDRRGNFLTHTVVFEDSLERYHIPCLLDVIPFRSSLTIEEESNFEIPPKTINITNENLSKEVTNKFVSILKSKVCYLDAFLEVIDIMIGGWLDSKGKSITISAPTNKECIDLIFAIYTILPAYVINHFSFATYVVHPSNVSFQICGVIPECGVTRLDSEYFKLIRVDELSNTYTPTCKFTRILKSWIINEQLDKIANIEKLFHDYGITRLDKSVEIPFAIEEFKEEIVKKSLPELNAILQGFAPSQQKLRKDLLNFIFCGNPNLYLEYIAQETKTYISKNHSISLHLDIIEKAFRNLHLSYSDKQLLTFFKEVESVFFDKTIINSRLLLDEYSDIKSIIKEKPLLCEYLLAYIDKKWNNVADQEKEAIVNEYHEWLLAKLYPNIQSWFSYKRLLDEIQNGSFLEKVNDHQTILSNLSKENLSIIVNELIETTNKKGKLSDRTLYEITLLVDKYLDESFWKKLFDDDDTIDKDKYWMKYRKAWSLSMIKRYYVYFYVSRHEELIKINRLVESLDEYEIRWVLEKLIEAHQKDGYERLSSILSTMSSKKKNGGWLNRVIQKKN